MPHFWKSCVGAQLFLALELLVVVVIQLINVKMPAVNVVGILTLLI